MDGLYDDAQLSAATASKLNMNGDAGGSKMAQQRPTFSSRPYEEDDPNQKLDHCNVFVKHLPGDVDDGKLFELFEAFGEITSAKV